MRNSLSAGSLHILLSAAACGQHGLNFHDLTEQHQLSMSCDAVMWCGLTSKRFKRSCVIEAASASHCIQLFWNVLSLLGFTLFYFFICLICHFRQIVQVCGLLSCGPDRPLHSPLCFCFCLRMLYKPFSTIFHFLCISDVFICQELLWAVTII